MSHSPILVLTGMPGARKTLVAGHLHREFGLLVVSLSHVIRDELVRRGENPSAESYERLATELRANEGEAAVAHRALVIVGDHVAGGLIIDGVRSPAEVDTVYQWASGPALLIAVVAPRRVRHGRIAAQNPTRLDDGWLERQDQHNLELGVGDCIALADLYIEHTGSPDRVAIARGVASALGQLPGGGR